MPRVLRGIPCVSPGVFHVLTGASRVLLRRRSLIGLRLPNRQSRGRDKRGAKHRRHPLLIDLHTF